MDSARLFLGDCLEVLKSIEGNSVDSLVTDPPAGIYFMNKEWDSDKGGREKWIEWFSIVMTEVNRVLKPGAHGLVWSIPRNAHWTAMALEYAGFEVRDCVTHLFGSGFPKSLNISKAIDKEAGVDRKVIGKRELPDIRSGAYGSDYSDRPKNFADVTEAATDAAKQWDGYGTALKPATERWIKIRKPLSEVPFWDIVGQISLSLGLILWPQLNAKYAQKLFMLNQKDYGKAPLDFVQWNVDVLDVLVSQEKSEKMVMSKSPEMDLIILSIAKSWRNFLAVSLNERNTFIISTESSTTTTLKTLNCYLSAIMQKSIHQLKLNGIGVNAQNASQIFIEEITSQSINHSVPENVFISLLEEAACILANSVTNLSDFFQVSLENSAHPIVTSKHGLETDLIWLIRKPISEKTVAKNVLKWGVGGLNIDQTRIKYQNDIDKNSATPQGIVTSKKPKDGYAKASGIVSERHEIERPEQKGRFPANLVLSHHEECELSPHVFPDGTTQNQCHEDCAVRLLDEQSGILKSGNLNGEIVNADNNIYGKAGKTLNRKLMTRAGSSGGASRFFYVAKASKSERNAGLEGINNHPTVKSAKLMSYLCKLITPPNGVILDPFMGSGSTGVAAKKEGFDFIGIEQSKEYFEIAEKRINLV